jgi:methylmalonyl-CoA carboxyltransferase small subunit
MMKRKFKVTVDGKTYTVEVEEETGKREIPNPVIPPKARVSVRERPVSTRATVEDGAITAPLPGVVSDIRVSKGDPVDAGAVLLVLEAMKMENEIHSPSSGVVEEVYVGVGEQVGRGAPLVKVL